MRWLFGDNGDQRPHDSETILAGRELLSRLDFSGSSTGGDNHLDLVVTTCLAGEEAADVAKALCHRYKSVATNAATDVDRFDDFFVALCKTQPSIVLDTFFAGNSDVQHGLAQMLEWRGTHRPNPFDAIPDDAMTEWCSHDPATRCCLLAGAVSFLKGPEDEAVASEWSSKGLKLIEQSPEPVEVIRIFVDRFRPSSWSGSRASILESRIALLKALEKNPNLHVAAYVAEEAQRLLVDVEAERQWEAEHDRSHDERFE